MTKTLEDRITELEKRMDDFNVRNEGFYSGIKDCLIQQQTAINRLKAEMEGVRRIAHKHFWMDD